MTASDKARFAQIFARLAIAVREKAPDALVLNVYYDGLRDCEIELVAAAADRLARANWFPRLGEWRHAVEAIERERVEAQQAMLRGLPMPLCEACSDTGWTMHESRASRCGCVLQRRLELLGRALPPPVPLALPPAPAPTNVFDVEASVHRTVRAMPKIRRGLTEAQYRARRKELQRQAELIQATRPQPRARGRKASTPVTPFRESVS